MSGGGGGRDGRMDWEYYRTRRSDERGGAFCRKDERNRRSGGGLLGHVQSHSSFHFRHQQAEQRHQQHHHIHHWQRPSMFRHKLRFGRKRRAGEIEMDEDWETSTNGEQTKSLIHLPDEVGEHICKMMDASSLLTMRRVSSTTKRWVESRQVMSQLTVEVNNSKQLQQVVKSNVPWSNFSIKCMSLGSHTSLNDFQTKMCKNIKVLKIFTPKCWSRKEELLVGSPRLEVLELSDFVMDVKDTSPTEVEQFKSICKNSVNMMHFKLDSIVTSQVELSIAAFFKWLSCMGQLYYLRIPKFVWNTNHMMSARQTLESRTKNQDCFITNFEEYVRKRQMADPRAKNLSILDVEEFVDYEGLQFHRLAAICANFNIKIVNVASYFLKKAKQFESAHMWPMINSLSGFDPLLPFDSMTNLTKMSMSCFIPHDHLNLMMPIGFQILLPQLKTLIINIYGQDSPFMQCMLDVFLHRTARPTVETLVVKCHETESDNFIRSQPLATNFSNAKTFELHNYKGNFEDYRTLFSTMTSLEDVTIKDCKQLTDQAFVIQSQDKHEPSSFIHLKSLRKLTIRTYERGITDLSLKVTFCHLPLRSFNFTCVGRPTITADGFRSLASLPLLFSVQYLDVVRPQDLSEREHKLLLLEFPNLVRRRN